MLQSPTAGYAGITVTIFLLGHRISFDATEEGTGIWRNATPAALLLVHGFADLTVWVRTTFASI